MQRTRSSPRKHNPVTPFEQSAHIAPVRAPFPNGTRAGRGQKREDGAGASGAEPRANGLARLKEPGQPDLVDAVLQRLTEHIIMGDFGTDGVLPSQGELATSFSVSRTVIREAMRGLCAQGLAEVSQGKAPRVKPPDSTATVASLRLLLRRNKATLLHLVEVRQPFESEIAALAAERANDEHVRQLQRAIDDLAAAPPLEARIEADVRFHRILAEATGNPVFVLLLETLAEFLQESRQKTLAYSGVGRALTGHRAILEAVRNRDQAKAREAMREHLTLAARDLESIGGRQKPRNKQAIR